MQYGNSVLYTNKCVVFLGTNFVHKILWLQCLWIETITKHSTDNSGSTVCLLWGCLFITVSFSSPEGDDYQLVDLQLEFLPGQERVEFNVTIVDNNMIEGEESFLLILSISVDITSKGVQLGPYAEATVTITDNDGELMELCTMQS